MKILSPEPTLDQQIPSSARQKTLENQAVFKKLMEKSSEKLEEEKKNLFSFLSVIDKEDQQLDPSLDEEILLQEEEESPHKEKKEPEINEQTSPFITTPYFSFQMQSPITISSEKSLIQQASYDIVSLMEKVGSEMIMMTSEGSTKTTLILNSEAFDSSILKEAKVTIEEFSSAPKIYNVKISAGPQAIELVRVHVEEFLKLFQDKKFGFSINRIDTELTSSRPLFSRKEKTDGEGSRNQQGRHKK